MNSSHRLAWRRWLVVIVPLIMADQLSLSAVGRAGFLITVQGVAGLSIIIELCPGLIVAIFHCPCGLHAATIGRWAAQPALRHTGRPGAADGRSSPPTKGRKMQKEKTKVLHVDLLSQNRNHKSYMRKFWNIAEFHRWSVCVWWKITSFSLKHHSAYLLQDCFGSVWTNIL